MKIKKLEYGAPSTTIYCYKITSTMEYFGNKWLVDQSVIGLVDSYMYIHYSILNIWK